jgi:putative endonuclease
MYYVYILLSLKDNNFYVGFSSDLQRRLAEHKNGKVKSTKNRLPFKLLCYEAYVFKQEAEKREKYLKSSDGRKDLRKRLTISLGQ